jgi:hypothetical protein
MIVKAIMCDNCGDIMPNKATLDCDNRDLEFWADFRKWVKVEDKDYCQECKKYKRYSRNNHVPTLNQKDSEATQNMVLIAEMMLEQGKASKHASKVMQAFVNERKK